MFNADKLNYDFNVTYNGYERQINKMSRDGDSVNFYSYKNTTLQKRNPVNENLIRRICCSVCLEGF